MRETKTNEWYNLAEDKNIEIKWNEQTNITIENELKKGQIKIIKVDSKNHEIRIPNVEFQILDVNDNVLEVVKTDENGICYTSKYNLRDYGQLRIKEIKTNELYELSNDILEVTLEENKTKEIEIENEKIIGNIKIIKTSKEDSIYAGIKKGEPLKDVKFEIYDINNNLIDTIITNEFGEAISKDLDKGTYKVKEVFTNEWYLLDENTYYEDIEVNGQIVTLNLENIPAKPDEKIEKTGPMDAKAGDEIVYEIYAKNNGNVPLDNFIWEDKIPTDYIRVTKMDLGTYNKEGTYDLYYKTNLSDDYILYLEDLNTKYNETIDFTRELKENEYLTFIKLDFGTIEIDFQNEEKSKIYAKVNENIKRDDIFINNVSLSSNYKGQTLKKEDKWETKIYELLPLTGM